MSLHFNIRKDERSTMSPFSSTTLGETAFNIDVDSTLYSSSSTRIESNDLSKPSSTGPTRKSCGGCPCAGKRTLLKSLNVQPASCTPSTCKTKKSSLNTTRPSFWNENPRSTSSPVGRGGSCGSIKSDTTGINEKTFQKILQAHHVITSYRGPSMDCSSKMPSKSNSSVSNGNSTTLNNNSKSRCSSVNPSLFTSIQHFENAKSFLNSSSSCSKSKNITSHNNINKQNISGSKFSMKNLTDSIADLSKHGSSRAGTSAWSSLLGSKDTTTLMTSLVNETIKSINKTMDQNESTRLEGTLFSQLLRNAGLGRFQNLFDRENIDALTFTLLRKQDLHRLGINSDEDIRRICGLIRIIVEFFHQRLQNLSLFSN